MARAITEQTRIICERYRLAIETGSSVTRLVGELAAEFDVQRPAIWKALRSGGALPEYAPQRTGGGGRPRGGGMRGYSEKRRSASLAASDRTIPPPAVCRDPCPRCGVRADIGCGHSKAPLGMIL